MSANLRQQISHEALPENGDLEVDNDSIYGSISGDSDTTTLNSSSIRGYVENGRRYQTLREYEAGHLTFLIMESQRKNPLFRAPINEETVENILDLGTGDGAYRYPQATVRGIDLYPPPTEWVPPNCILEVDDVQKFEFSTKFDLIHIRQLMGSFSFPIWDEVYKRSYDNLHPGGWFEEAEMITQVFCDDGSAPDDAPILHSHEIVGPAAIASGNPQTMFKEMRGMIEKAGFVNVQEKVMKIPFGDWPKHPVYKDAGRCNKIHYLSGIEGWTMWLMTKFGQPKPWSVEETTAYIEKLKADMNNPKYHLYLYAKIVWGQRPLEDKGAGESH